MPNWVYSGINVSSPLTKKQEEIIRKAVEKFERVVQQFEKQNAEKSSKTQKWIEESGPYFDTAAHAQDPTRRRKPRRKPQPQQAPACRA